MLQIKEEAGQGLAEYGLILVLIAVIIVAVLTLIGQRVSGYYSTIVDRYPGI